MKNDRLLRYLPWMFRDYVLWAGVATYVIVFGFGWLFWKGASISVTRMTPDQMARVIQQVASTLTIMVASLGPLIATLSLVSIDRMQGYYRFLFSRPVSPQAYYASKFAINGVGFLVAAAALWATFHFAIAPQDVPRYLPVMALSYVFFGGIVFLTSVLTRFDLVLSMLVYVVSGVAWAKATNDADQTSAVAKLIIKLLPPVHKHAAFVSSVFQPAAVISWKEVVWVAGYGLACFAIGILVLRRRGLAD